MRLREVVAFQVKAIPSSPDVNACCFFHATLHGVRERALKLVHVVSLYG